MSTVIPPISVMSSPLPGISDDRQLKVIQAKAKVAQPDAFVLGTDAFPTPEERLQAVLPQLKAAKGQAPGKSLAKKLYRTLTRGKFEKPAIISLLEKSMTGTQRRKLGKAFAEIASNPQIDLNKPEASAEAVAQVMEQYLTPKDMEQMGTRVMNVVKQGKLRPKEARVVLGYINILRKNWDDMIAATEKLMQQFNTEQPKA